MFTLTSQNQKYNWQTLSCSPSSSFLKKKGGQEEAWERFRRTSEGVNANSVPNPSLRMYRCSNDQNVSLFSVWSPSCLVSSWLQAVSLSQPSFTSQIPFISPSVESNYHDHFIVELLAIMIVIPKRRQQLTLTLMLKWQLRFTFKPSLVSSERKTSRVVSFISLDCFAFPFHCLLIKTSLCMLIFGVILIQVDSFSDDFSCVYGTVLISLSTEYATHYTCSSTVQ